MTPATAQRRAVTDEPAGTARSAGRGWTISDRARADGLLFEAGAWFALDVGNRRVPRVVVPTLDAGLGLIGQARVASIVGRLRPGVWCVDIDLPGVAGHAAAEALAGWAARRGLWSLVRPSGGGDGRAHVYLTAGDRVDDLRDAVHQLRAAFGVSRPQLDVRRQVRPLSAPHRLGGDTVPYADPASSIATLSTALAAVPTPPRVSAGAALMCASRRRAPEILRLDLDRDRHAPVVVETGACGRGERRGVALVPRPRRARALPAPWETYLRDGTRPRIGGSDTAGRSNYEAILTGHLLRAGHDHDSAWQVITTSHPAAMSKAKDRGRAWWTAWVWNRAVTDDHTYQPDPQPPTLARGPGDGVAAAVNYARATLTEYAWSLPPRRRPAVLLVGHHVLDRAQRTGRLRVPVPERDLREDTGLDRTTIRHVLRALHGHLGVLHTRTLDRRPAARATTSHAFEITPTSLGESRIPPPSLHHPPPSGTWPALPRVAHQLWRALQSAAEEGLALDDVARGALLTAHPTAPVTASPTRTARRGLAALAAGGLARCDAHGHWHPTRAATVEHEQRAAAAYADLHRPILIERILYRSNGANDWNIARAAALKAQHARQRAWWNTLTPEQRARRHQTLRYRRGSGVDGLSHGERGIAGCSGGAMVRGVLPRSHRECMATTSCSRLVDRRGGGSAGSAVAALPALDPFRTSRRVGQMMRDPADPCSRETEHGAGRPAALHQQENR